MSTLSSQNVLSMRKSFQFAGTPGITADGLSICDVAAMAICQPKLVQKCNRYTNVEYRMSSRNIANTS